MLALTMHPEWAWRAIHAGSLVGGRRGRAHEEDVLRRMLEVEVRRHLEGP